MKKFIIIMAVSLMTLFLAVNELHAQIWEPEGLNMPGDWNAWVNPPTNNLALASYTQVAGGQVVKISNGTSARWHTTIHVLPAGGDVVGGTYEWLFTSGPNASSFSNKWAGVNVVPNTIQTYSFNNGANNSVTLLNNHWYSINWEDIGYFDTKAIFMETSTEPIDITSLDVPVNPMPNSPVVINISLSSNLGPEEMVYVRYTTDNWNSSAVVLAGFAGISGTATIPGQAANTAVEYYAFSSTMSGINGDFDLQTIHLNNNAGANYSYTIGNPPPPTINWVNLQWPASGTIDMGQAYHVYAQIYMSGVTEAPGQGADVQAWIGYSTTDSDPSTWTNWVPATFNTDAGNNDEYVADLGGSIPQAGNYFYASRFQYQNQTYVYGGFNGGFWDGNNNVSGTLSVNSVIPISNWAMALFGLFFLSFVFFRYRK